MQLIWHIFRKDARRLWWALAPAFAMLLWFGHVDRWRGDQMAGSAESLLAVLTPVLWVLITGLLVLEDRVIGDREFWLTLPCGWRTMLAAKALFLVAFINAPCFLVQGAILWARGFPPYLYLPQLMWKQAQIAMLIVSAMALALLVRNMAQYLLAAVLAAVAVTFVQSLGLQSSLTLVTVRRYTLYGDWLRTMLALAPALAVAAALIVFQYARRRAGVARAAGVAALLVSAAIYSWLPQTASAEWRCALNPATGAAPVSIGLSPAPVVWTPAEVWRWEAMYQPRGGVSINVPLVVSGNPVGPLSSVNDTKLDMRLPDGTVFGWSSSSFENYPVYRGYVSLRPPQRTYASLYMSRALFDRAKRSPVDLNGSLEVYYRRLGPTTSVGLMTRANAPGVGKCVSSLTQGGALRPGTLKVDCESPLEIAYPTRVAVVHPETGRRWANTLSGSGTPWLSPINHRTAHFQLVTEEVYASERPGGRWVVPEEALPTSTLEIMPELPAGSTFVKYELRGVDLKRYVPPGK
jgi:hypothetical protein